MDIVNKRFAPHTVESRLGGRPRHGCRGRHGGGTRSRELVAHLKGREKALGPFGWTGYRAEWMALACLHGGIFTRAQWTSFLGCHHEKVRRAVRALVVQGVAVEEKPVGIRGIGRVCRIRGRSIYGALRAEGRPRRRITSAEVLMRRLLSLDYVLDHLHLPWLPTEPEKVTAFEALGIERRILPQRTYRGAAGGFRRYFPLRLPVALDGDRALFVYVDPGHDTSKALRSWGAAHRRLWMALAERGRSVEVVAVVRTYAEFDRAEAVLRGWSKFSGRAKPDAEILEELARIERAILQGAVRVLEEFGGLQAALKRSIALEKQVHRQPAPGLVQHASTWQTTRLAGARYL